ncbi:unnamed protein product, partial [Porites lobata]
YQGAAERNKCLSETNLRSHSSVRLQIKAFMAMSGIREASPESDEKVLDFDDATLEAIAEVYKTEGDEAYSKEDYSNAVYFYAEGIKVKCKNEDLKSELYSNRAYANLLLGNYIYSLVDAKNATDLRPLSIKPMIAGAKASVKLSLRELAIFWCNTGLAVSFFSV